MKKQQYIVIGYTFIGIIFGSLFPIVAYIYEISSRGLDYSIKSISFIHKTVNLMYMIDSAPIFLGLFSMIAGINYAKSFYINEELKRTTLNLLESEKSLIKMSDSLKDKNNNLERDFYYDKLTGLPNEKYLIKKNLKDKYNLLLISVNISHFREINTLFGYEVGDEILKKIALRILENDFECYKGHADEFILLSYEAVDYLEVDILSNYIFNLLSDEVYVINDLEIYLTITLGFSILNKNEQEDINITNLIHNSSFALKYAKEKNLQYAFYNNDLIKSLKNNYSYKWKKKIINAIQNSEVITFFQPIINNKTGIAEKYEALIRLKDDNQFISPYHFMTSARKYGLYNNLTKLVVNYAINHIEKFDREISINISIDDIRNISTMKLIYGKIKNLKDGKAKNIVFELLESEGIENYNEVKTFISDIKKFGCKVAIDDFGSGYSNFSHILNLNVDYIKIDASIIKNIVEDKNSEYIAKLIVDFSNRVGVKTIAEFVHSKEVFEKVKDLGVDYSQGYYFSEPLEFIDISKEFHC